jgi:hypothetical protein
MPRRRARAPDEVGRIEGETAVKTERMKASTSPTTKAPAGTREIIDLFPHAARATAEAIRASESEGGVATEPAASEHLLVRSRALRAPRPMIGIGNPEGRLVDERTDLPLVGLRVTAWVGIESPDASECREERPRRATLVGESVSGRNGRFKIPLATDERAQRELVQLEFGSIRAGTPFSFECQCRPASFPGIAGTRWPNASSRTGCSG